MEGTSADLETFVIMWRLDRPTLLDDQRRALSAT